MLTDGNDTWLLSAEAVYESFIIRVVVGQANTSLDFSNADDPASIAAISVGLAGMRDAGLMHTAKALSEAQTLDDLVVAIEDDTDEAVASFEALFEVYGIDRLNFEANLVYVHSLDVSAIWSHDNEL